MRPLRLEAKRFLYSLWMLPAVLVVLAGLIFFTYKTGVNRPGADERVLLGMLLGAVEYHILLYGVLAVALAGIDVSYRIPLMETLAGGTPYRFLLRKLLLFAAAVVICELAYLVVPVLLWRIPLSLLLLQFPEEELVSPMLWLVPARLFLDLGIALPLFLLQTALPSIQSMLIVDSAAAILWIGLHDDDLTAWIYGMMFRPLPWTWFLWAGLAILLSVLFSFGTFRLKARFR